MSGAINDTSNYQFIEYLHEIFRINFTWYNFQVLKFQRSCFNKNLNMKHFKTHELF